MFNFYTFIVKGMNKNPFHNTWGNIKAWRYDICIEKCIFNEIAKSKSINFGCLLAARLSFWIDCLNKSLKFMILQYLPDSKEVIGELIEHIFCPKGIFWLCDSCQVNNAAAASSTKYFSVFK